jgi:hypothetical protein
MLNLNQLDETRICVARPLSDLRDEWRDSVPVEVRAPAIARNGNSEEIVALEDERNFATTFGSPQSMTVITVRIRCTGDLSYLRFRPWRPLSGSPPLATIDGDCITLTFRRPAPTIGVREAVDAKVEEVRRWLIALSDSLHQAQQTAAYALAERRREEQERPGRDKEKIDAMFEDLKRYGLPYPAVRAPRKEPMRLPRLPKKQREEESALEPT